MTERKLKKLFALATELFHEEQKKSGMLRPMPYAWAKNNETGCFLAFSAFPAQSDVLEAKVKEILN